MEFILLVQVHALPLGFADISLWHTNDSTFSFSSCNTDTISSKITEQYNVIADFMSTNKLKLNGDAASYRECLEINAY